MRYYHQLNYRQRRKFLRRIRLLALLVIICAVIGAGLVFNDNRSRSVSNTPEQTTSQVTTSYFAPSIQIFRTGYFQFQANSSWSQASPESSDSKFVYRSMRGTLIDHELIIYVNRKPDEKSVTRVLPVNLKKNSELVPLTISENCGKTLQPTAPVVPGVVDRVSLDCAPNDPRYVVAAGLVGGSTKLTLERPGGGSAVYSIYYSNLTANPEGSQFVEIAGTFQAR